MSANINNTEVPPSTFNKNLFYSLCNGEIKYYYNDTKVLHRGLSLVELTVLEMSTTPAKVMSAGHFLFFGDAM